MSEAIDTIREHVAFWQQALQAIQPGTWQHVCAKRQADYYEAQLSAASYDAYQQETLGEAERQAEERAYWTINGEPVETPAERDAEIAHYAQMMAVMASAQGS